MRFRDKASMSGQIRKSIRENGLTIKCMAKVTLSGLMVNSTLENSKKTNVMVKVGSFGKMEGSTREAGTKESSTELASTQTIIASSAKVNG